MLLPTNLSAPAAAARRFARFCRESADVRKPFVQTSTTDRTPHLTVEPFVSTESVYLLSRPTWVLSVIPRKGALSHWESIN